MIVLLFIIGIESNIRISESKFEDILFDTKIKKKNNNFNFDILRII